MITMEDWITIKNLRKRRPDLGTRKIADLLGFSRNLVRRALASESGPHYQRPRKINPAIKPFEEVIYDMLINKRYRGSRILNEIRSKGYEGSKSAFYRYISILKQPLKRHFMPYETAPGEQAQFDWSLYTVLIDGQLTRVTVFNYILGFSRFQVYEASLSQTQGSVFEALENSFVETGGIPERIQTDNAKCFIINASKENFQWNKRYLQFCGHYGIKPTRSLPGHPWSKGKVEKPFDYLENHFIKGNSFESFTHFIKELKKFQTEVNERIHGSTKQPPAELSEQEKHSLMSLPETRYVNVKEQVRKATADCLISFDGNRYSLPWQFACREVWVRVSKGYFLEIYSSTNKLIASHVLETGKGKVIIKEEHYRGHRPERGNWMRLSQTFLEKFPNHRIFLEKLKAQKRINPSYHLTRILDIIKFYDKNDVIETFNSCFTYNIFTFVFIQGYLENYFTRRIIIDPLPLKTTIGESVSIKRDLQEYKREVIV